MKIDSKEKKGMCLRIIGQTIVLLAIMAASAFSDNRCIMSFSACPETFKNKTILVPNNVIGITPSILTCNDSMQNIVTSTPSILFVIDNSPSMVMTNDTTGTRFNVTRDLIDSIAAKWPQAEVGLVIFQAGLEFNTGTSATHYYTKYFKRMSKVYMENYTQAYLPFLSLNGDYNGKTGKTILYDALKTDIGNNSHLDYPTPYYNQYGGTNINLGFLAAREAFANAKSPKDQQYLIFLSDGEPTTFLPGYDSLYFRDSTQGVPTTFTVFFPAGPVPASLQKMTDNIKINNYSATNPQSGITSINASYQNLMTALMKNVISQIVVRSTPFKLVLNADSSSMYVNGHFVFPDTFKIDSGVNRFVMKVAYRLTDPSTGQQWDTVKQIDFSVQRSSGATTPPVGIDLTCFESDSLQIVVGGNNTPIKTLTMRTDARDTSLQVQHKNPDNGLWESTTAHWSIVPGIKMSTQPQDAGFWTFSPIDTGSGIIVVSKPGIVSDTIAVHFLPGLADRLVLFPSPGAPSPANAEYQSPAIALIDTAGNPLKMYAKLFDKNGVWLGGYERASSPIAWSIMEIKGNPPTGVLNNAAGYTSAFTPARAYNTVSIIARLDSAGLPATACDTVKIQVVPAPPSQLVVEADSNWRARANTAAPVDSIKLTNNRTWAPVYALLRDRFGNFVKYSTNTTWGSFKTPGIFDSSIVSVQSGITAVGEGIVRSKADKGFERVFAASNEFPAFADTIKAVVVDSNYKELRIVVRGDTPISRLTISTNNDTLLQVQGLLAETDQWESVNAKWEISTGLQFRNNQTPPNSADKWFFSPGAPGAGWIRVTLGKDAQSRPDTVPVTFTVGAPLLIETEILTPLDRRIAGDTIVGVTRIKNRDGLVPGSLCDTTMYRNALGTGGRPNPTANGVDMGKNRYECFQNGIDTVKYVLYHAPAAKDSLEKVMVTLGALSAVSDPFVLHPGVLAGLSLEDVNRKGLDSAHLASPAGSQLIVSTGYDAYGNYRGPENSNWTVNGTLHAIDKFTGLSRVFYEAGEVKYGEEGIIHASAKGESGSTVSDSVWVTITGRPGALMSAMTHDMNGNGLLDRITLIFDKAVTFTEGTRIRLSNSGDKLWIAGVRGKTSAFVSAVDTTTGLVKGAAGPDSEFTLVLSENNTTVPQTGWEPALTVTGAIGITPLNGHTVTDGAGPVIWSVEKTITSQSDRTQDKVTVTFSEPIGTRGNDFDRSMAPGSIFRVWELKTAESQTDTIENLEILSGIESFFRLENKTTVLFYMTNNKDLTSYHYFNLVADSSTKRLTDKGPVRANPPVEDNRKVHVQIESGSSMAVVAVPNPSVPTFRRENAGVFTFKDNLSARSWIRDDRAGMVITFQIVKTDEVIKGTATIYDVAGNIVNQSSSVDVLSSLRPTATVAGTVYNYDIYWNGSNKKGRTVARGVYGVKIVLSNASIPLWTIIGIRY
jgi:hypothetical protein